MTVVRRVLLLLSFVLTTGGPALAQSAQSPPPAASETNEQRARGFFVRGMTAAALDDPEEARSHFERALDLAGAPPALLLALADAHAAQGDQTSALYYAERAHDRAPDRPHFYRRLAELQWKAGRLEAAASTYRSLLDRFPETAHDHLRLSQVLTEQGQFKAAVQHVEAIAPAPLTLPDVFPVLSAFLPSSPPVRVSDSTALAVDDALRSPAGLAVLRDHPDRTEQVVEWMEARREGAPEPRPIREHLRFLYQFANRPDSAYALPSDPGSASPVDGRVVEARSILGSEPTPSDFQEARRILEGLLERTPDYVPALDLLGRLHLETDAPSQAVSLFTRALEEDPRSAKRWERVVTALLRSDQASKAVDRAEEGLLLFPGHVPLLRLAAEAHLRTASSPSDPAVERARTRAEQAVDRDSTSSAVLRTLSRVHYRRDNLREAETVLQRALKRDSVSAETYDLAGDVQAALGNEEQARTFWHRALANEPDRESVQKKLDGAAEDR